MGWERKKAKITAEPEEPSLVIWLIAGFVAVIAGILIFVLHANQFLRSLQRFNPWIVAFIPFFIWFTIICIRGWIYNHAMDRHQFEFDEADYAQQQWVSWAGRHLAVLYSRVLLPEGMTPSTLLEAPPDREQRNSLSLQLPLPAGENAFSVLLSGLDMQVLQDLSAHPFNITLLTDSSDTEETFQRVFSAAWLQIAGQTLPVPALTTLRTKTFMLAGERLKSPVSDIELLLVHQMEGGDEYSDVFAALLLTSDDVATRYQLIHDACILRPMSLGMAEADSELEIFFSTQTQANSTVCIVGDRVEWGVFFPTLLDAAQEHGGSWKPEETHWLEKYAGISGPFSPWIMAAVASDIVSMQKADCLMLSSDGEQRFINTVKTGNRNNDNG